MASAVGIDLGTTNPVVATFEGGEPTAIANAEGARTTPSVVASKTGEVLVGEAAKAGGDQPDRTVRSVKRQGRVVLALPGRRQGVLPQQISAFILQKLKRDAEAYLGDQVTQAASPCPPTSTTPSARPPRRPVRLPASRSCGSSTSRPRPRSPTPGQGERRDHPRVRPRRRHLRRLPARHRRGGHRGPVDPGTCTWAATTGTSGSSRRLLTTFKNNHGIDLSNDKMAMQRARRGGREGQDRASSTLETTIIRSFITATPRAWPTWSSASPGASSSG